MVIDKLLGYFDNCLDTCSKKMRFVLYFDGGIRVGCYDCEWCRHISD